MWLFKVFCALVFLAASLYVDVASWRGFSASRRPALFRILMGVVSLVVASIAVRNLIDWNRSESLVLPEVMAAGVILQAAIRVWSVGKRG